MEKYIIEGNKKLKGEVNISGAKNSALPILIATILTDETCVIENVPKLMDVFTTIEMLKSLGKRVSFRDNIVRIETVNTPRELTVPYELVKRMRASFLIAGALLGRYKSAKVSLPGGCLIGVRPVDLHLFGFEMLGSNVNLDEGYVLLNAKKLKGNEIPLRYPSVGATENILMASVFANGKTTISNYAKEPEVTDLINFLNNMGAKIKRKRDVIEVNGVKKLRGIKYKIIPDRVETSTYLIAGAITKGEVKVRNCCPEHLSIVISKLKKAGLELTVETDSITIKYVRKLKPVSITSKPYPGFPTDLQAQWMALMSVTEGKCYIRETVFENRFLHAAELNRLGANIVINGDTAIVKGVKKLTGAPVMVTDLRAGAALILAGLAAEGVTEVSHIYHLARGYEDLEEKLKSIGAKIKRADQ